MSFFRGQITFDRAVVPHIFPVGVGAPVAQVAQPRRVFRTLGAARAKEVMDVVAVRFGHVEGDMVQRALCEK